MKWSAIVSTLFIHYLAWRCASARGLTTIKRGCIGSYLRHKQLLNASLPIGPVPPGESLCRNIVTSVRKSVIDDVVTTQAEHYEELDDVDAYKTCLRDHIERNNLTDFLIKSFMYREEEIENSGRLKSISEAIAKTFDYLCHESKFIDDFTQKFPGLFAGYEKEIDRICLIELLREKEVIDQDFQIEFDTTDTSAIKCPEYINEEMLQVRTEGSHLLHQSPLYEEEEIWKCATEERMKLAFVLSYYRFLAYALSHESDERKEEEREKFLDILRKANELAVKCFVSGYESL